MANVSIRKLRHGAGKLAKELTRFAVDRGVAALRAGGVAILPAVNEIQGDR